MKDGGGENSRAVGKWCINGVNENGPYLVDICAEKSLFLSNTFQLVRVM